MRSIVPNLVRDLSCTGSSIFSLVKRSRPKVRLLCEPQKGCLLDEKTNNIGWLFILEMLCGAFSKLKNVVLKTKVQV